MKLCNINHQIRFLSRYFLGKNESLIHGAEICGEFLEDVALAEEIANEKKTARELFTFEFIQGALTNIFRRNHEKIISELVRMLAFDALVGNNDRHFYNWGIITTKKKSNQLPRFAPIYDSARGLLWNVSDETLLKWKRMQSSGGKHLERYINEACPRISIEKNKEIDHFGLIAFLKNENQVFKETINALTSLDIEEKILRMLEEDFFSFFIKERSEFTTYIINTRFKKIREI